MKKFLSSFLLMASLALTATSVSAQVNTYIDIPVPDPSYFTVFTATPMSQFPTGGFSTYYIIDVPAGMSGLGLDFSSNGTADTLLLNTSCTPTINTLDADIGNHPFLPVSASTNNTQVFIPGLQGIYASAGAPRDIVMPVSGCARVGLALTYSSGTLTDKVTMAGNFTSNSQPLFPGGAAGTYILGLGVAGVPGIVGYDAAKAALQVQSLTTPYNADNVAGAFNSCPGSNCLSGIANSYFNGAAWDMAVKCPNWTNLFISAGSTQQIISPIAAKLGRVCSLFLIFPTTGTFSIFEGTGASCATGFTYLLQTSTFPAGVFNLFSGGTAEAQTQIAGDGLCLKSAANSSVVTGYVTWEQH